MKTNTDAAAAKVAATWPASPDRSLLRFNNLVNAAAKGTGVTNKGDLKRIWTEIRRKAISLGVVPNGSQERRAG